MNDWGIGIALEGVLRVGCALLAVFVPLGAWKLLEIIIWLCRHVHWSVL